MNQVNAAQITPAVEGGLDDDKKTKGNQTPFVMASVDPTSFVLFRVKEDVIAHFSIEVKAKSIADSDVAFVAKRKPTVTGGGGTTPTTVVSSGAGTIKPKDAKIIGRAIRIPTGGGLTRTNKRSLIKQIKMVTIRVPACMSLSAVVLWINTAFSGTRKPSYFFSPGGAKVLITKGFADKTKLANKKNE
jgi:hypothetical protein